MTSYPMPTLVDLDAMLTYLSPDMLREDWVRVLMAAQAEFGDEARDICERWSALSEKYRAENFRMTWKNINGNGVTFRTLAWMARQEGYEPPKPESTTTEEAKEAPRAPRPALDPEQEAREAEERTVKLRAAIKLIDLSHQITAHDPAGQYLNGRKSPLPPADSDLRWSPMVKMFGFAGPALIGRITRADDAAKTIGAHITWIAENGTGGWRRVERRYLGSKAGGVVRLWPDEAVTDGLAVAEGIETALSVAHVFRPIWAAMDAGNLGAFPVVPGIEALTIIADNDKSGTGQEAASRCAHRWHASGREVRIAMPEILGADANDLEVHHERV